jgi:hypothetical protein
MICHLEQDAIERDSNLIWNTFVGIIAMPYENLAPQQRPSHLVFVYESEVQNGGHYQYFENSRTDRLQETITALDHLGAQRQKAVLKEAGEAFLSRQRAHPQSAEEFVAGALEGEFSSFDARFHECVPSLIEYLEEHLRLNLSTFIQVT